MSNSNKVAVITGAGSGIGKAVSHILLENNYRVVFTGRNADKLEAAAADSGVDKTRTLCVSADVGDSNQVDHLFDSAMQKFGRLDLLFNNAGVFAPQMDIDEMPVDQWQRSVDANISGAFFCARRAFGIMKKQTPKGGRIINNGSISAHSPRPGGVPYTVSKHAMTGLTKCLALDGRPHDIACGQIDIGNALTDIAVGLGKGAKQPNGDIVPEPLMDVGHVATSVLHMAQLPLDANVLFMTVMASKMPFVGRG